MLTRSRGVSITGMPQAQQQFSRVKVPQHPVYTTNLAPPVPPQIVVHAHPIQHASRKNSFQVPSKEMRALWRGGQHIQRPTVVSADMSESQALNRLSLVEDNSAHLALQQSLHTINQSSQREHTPNREMEELAREREDLRKERELFFKEQDAARKEQQAIRREQQQIRKEQELFRREQEELFKERQNIRKEKESLAKLHDSARQESKHSLAGQSTPAPTPESILLDFNNSRLSKQVSNVQSLPQKPDIDLLRKYEAKVKQLQQLADRRRNQVSQTIEVAEKREKQIINEFENYIDKLRTEKHQLLEMNKQYEEQIHGLREEMEKARQISTEHYTHELDRITNLLVAKQNQIHQLNEAVAQMETDLGSSKNVQFDLNLKLINYQKRVQLLETEIMKYTDVIRKKNQELYQLKNLSFQTDKTSSISKHIQSATREVDRLNELILQKSAESSQYRTEIGDLQIKLAKAVHRQDALNEEKQVEINRLREQIQSKQFEYNKIRQTVMIKETHISELQSAKDQMRHKVALLQDEVDRVKDENKYLINDLQHRNIEMEKRNKQLETELRDARKAINEFSRMRHHIDDRSPEQIKVLQEKVADLMSQLDKEKTESIRSRKKFQDNILSYQRLKVQFEQRTNELSNSLLKKSSQLQHANRQISSLQSYNSELNHKLIKLVQEKDELQKQLMSADNIKSAKQAQIDKKALQLQQLTNEYNLMMNRYRSDYERTYHDTLKEYENKISTMEKEFNSSKKNRSPKLSGSRSQIYDEEFKELKKENKKLKQLLEQRENQIKEHRQADSADNLQGMIEIQVRCNEFQQRLQTAESPLAGVFNKLVNDIHAQMKKLRQENSILRKNQHRMRSATQYERMMNDMASLEEKNQNLSHELTRLSQELAGSRGSDKKEKIALLQQKAQYYQSKTTQLESRANQLQNKNSDLIAQLAHYKTHQESNKDLEQKLNILQSELAVAKSQLKKSRTPSLKVQYQSQIAQQQMTIASLQHQLTDQTKQRIFYQEQNILNEERITQLSHQLTASVSNSQPYEFTQNLTHKNQELRKKVQALALQNSALRSSRITADKKIQQYQIQLKNKGIKNAEESEFRSQIAHLEQTVAKLNDHMQLLNNRISTLNTERQRLLLDVNKYQLEIKSLKNRSDDTNELQTTKSGKKLPVVLQEQLARLSQDLLIIRSQRDIISAKQQQLNQQNAQLVMNMQYLQQEQRQNKLNIINIYRTFTLFAQRLKAISSNLQSLFNSVNPAHSIPEPLADLTSILSEILQWSIQQQRLYQENSEQDMETSEGNLCS